MKVGFLLFCKGATEMHILRNKKSFIMRRSNNSEQVIGRGCEPLKVLKSLTGQEPEQISLVFEQEFGIRSWTR